MKIDVNMQLSHMLANEIARNGEESAIIDTIHTLQTPVTRDSIDLDIQRVFHITLPKERLSLHIRNMLSDGRLCERNNSLVLSPTALETINQKILQNETIEQKALALWIEQFSISIGRQLTDVEETGLKSIIIKFVARFFLTHGAGCYDFISGNKMQEIEKLDEVASAVVDSSISSVGTIQNNDLIGFLTTIFTTEKSIEQESFLLIQLRKAVHYISTVVDESTINVLISSFNGIVVYLDTSILYRLLNFQREQRYKSIMQLYTYCKAAKMKLKVFQCTVDELKRRIAFDASVITKYPVPVSFASIGYKCRTDENYISTFWKERAKTGITAEDFNFQYSDILALLDHLNIEVETETQMDNECVEQLRTKVRSYGTFSNDDEKSYNAVEHDAECLAQIIARQRKNATSALEARTFLLSTDWSLVRLQRFDHDYKDRTDMVVLPSQLMQIFCLSTPQEDYFEAFLGLFASAHVGFGTNQLDNEQVQQIMGRVAYYSDRPEFAQRVLCNQLIQQKFADQETEEKKVAIVDDAIKEEIEKLESEKEQATCALEQAQDAVKNAQHRLTQSLEEKQVQQKESEQVIARLTADYEKRLRESQKAIEELQVDREKQVQIIQQRQEDAKETANRLLLYERQINELRKYYIDVQHRRNIRKMIVCSISLIISVIVFLLMATLITLAVLLLFSKYDSIC